MKSNTEKKNQNKKIANTTENLKDQNAKIAFIKDDMMVVGVDVGSENHYARAFTNRKIELSRKPYHFENSQEGFKAFEAWIGCTNGLCPL